MRILTQLNHRFVDGRVNDAQIAIEGFAHLTVPTGLVQFHPLIPVGDCLLLLPVTIFDRCSARIAHRNKGALDACPAEGGELSDREYTGYRDDHDQAGGGSSEFRKRELPALVHQAKPPAGATGHVKGPGGHAFGFNDVTDPQPQGVLIWHCLILTAVILTKTNNRNEIVANLSANQTIFQVCFYLFPVCVNDKSVNQVTEQLLILLAVHFFQPSRVAQLQPRRATFGSQSNKGETASLLVIAAISLLDVKLARLTV